MIGGNDAMDWNSRSDYASLFFSCYLRHLPAYASFGLFLPGNIWRGARARADCTHTDSDSAWSSSHHLPYEEEERPAAACVPYLLPAPQGERINE